ncbi:hypothetical protein [Mucilaginibacter phyllosphaerae]|uniref:Uncharacterized protein n=1 Tax=Mucilaginibacter phyllosphaerae TaxID=1812349 RepID=A0A4Y8A6V7_9SPHI|nr:hypothetical protein [Mucilaginibacter phyllosphaerae]MBB3970926.1 hypothetical protein [Mucilaginibacter phyllosphaerae]TEW64140.1 hypothetical protein E2R65_17485 [Mucilaginibacter phyllosphaerae]GGH05479.1 hypothetical protein GCM10007352_09270 [Mucilaginibacter phyllosphaerae]
MKKLFISTAIAALFTANIFAANTITKSEEGSDNVSYIVNSKFNSDFVRAENVTWKVTPKFQKATFTLDGVKKAAFYNLRGELIGVTENVQFKELPTKAKKEIGLKYAGYFANEVIKFDNGDNGFDSTAYFVDLKNDKEEVLVRVTPSAGVYFFQQVK